MKSLTGLDATFLYLETPELPMHVGSFNLCELPKGLKGSFHQAVTAHISKRLHLAPVFSRKLVFMPLDLGHPLWVEADSVDIGFHIRQAHLPVQPGKKSATPMTLALAHEMCAQLHSELIDRNFPLWEFYVFERIELPNGKIVGGFFSKIHHAALDGKAAVLLANALLDLTPTPREVPPPDPSRKRLKESDLKIGKMIGSVFSSSLGQLIKAAKLLPSAAATLTGALGSQVKSARKMPTQLAPATPFNAGISSERVFVTATVPLAECKALGKAVGGSLNDIVLWICSTALRNYLLKHHSLPKKSLVAAMPVSLRESGATDAAQLGNQVSMTLVDLGTHLAKPLKRMNAIMASTAKVKGSVRNLKGLLPTDYPSLLAPWLVGGAAKMALNAYGKHSVASGLPMVANLVISNVPGTPVPLYLAGAKFLSFHPTSIIMHGLGLNITVQTYAGRADFGIVASKQALPHANDFAQAIESAFAEAMSLLNTQLHPSTELAVTKATNKAKLDGTPPEKGKLRRDTLRKSNPKLTPTPTPTPTPTASQTPTSIPLPTPIPSSTPYDTSLGKPIVKKVAKRKAASTDA